MTVTGQRRKKQQANCNCTPAFVSSDSRRSQKARTASKLTSRHGQSIGHDQSMSSQPFPVQASAPLISSRFRARLIAFPSALPSLTFCSPHTAWHRTGSLPLSTRLLCGSISFQQKIVCREPLNRLQPEPGKRAGWTAATPHAISPVAWASAQDGPLLPALLAHTTPTCTPSAHDSYRTPTGLLPCTPSALPLQPTPARTLGPARWSAEKLPPPTTLLRLLPAPMLLCCYCAACVPPRCCLCAATVPLL